ncbi:hypothetical protein [Glaciibacter sp. 2TAF33]|uniref:hypothetical protein n=1 Tax=Glaciibacter sp. 2TAF33 TaxID=3233015 RepID=UPI003F939A40
MRTGLRSAVVTAAAMLSVTAAVLAMAGCSSAVPAAAPTRPADGVSVEIFQNRQDYAVRVLEIGVTNGGASDLELVSAAFESPQFTGIATWKEPLTITAGSATDLRVQLGTAVCDGRGGGTGQVTMVWRAGSARAGGTGSASLTPADTKDTIDRIVREDCLAAAVDSVVAIIEPASVRIDGTGAASVAWLDLTVTPTGAGGSVTVDRVSATVLLASASGLDWPVGLTLDAASPPQTVSLALRPTRCDPHAVIEDKRGTVFPFQVTTSSGPAGTYNFAVSDVLRRQVYDWIAAHCSY